MIKALRGWALDKTLVAMPTHTWSYPRPNAETPVYDVESTASLVGAITDFFWRQSGVTRSLHPSHSLACLGANSDRFCLDHERRETPCGEQTPYEQMATSNSSVLMFGATMDSYTLFHTAEDAAKVPYLYKPEKLVLKSKMKRWIDPSTCLRGGRIWMCRDGLRKWPIGWNRKNLEALNSRTR